MTEAVVFSTAAFTLYVGHHIGDYWVQTDHQAQHKGAAGWEGRVQCLLHVLSYTLTQTVLLVVTLLALGLEVHPLAAPLGMLVSAVTHYLADRREYGWMVKLAWLIPGKAAFLRLGIPRQDLWVEAERQDGTERDWTALDNPSLGTGAWALDQSWHIALGVWLPALIIGAMS